MTTNPAAETTPMNDIEISADRYLTCGYARSEGFVGHEGEYAHPKLIEHLEHCIRTGFGVTTPIHWDERFYQGDLSFWWE